MRRAKNGRAYMSISLTYSQSCIVMMCAFERADVANLCNMEKSVLGREVFMVGDLTGSRFGMLVVTRFLGKTKYSDKIWECICDCGNITKVTQGHLRSGHTRSCGCQKNKLENLVGKTFGYLTVISRDEDYLTPSSGKRYTQWLCQCVCGNTTVVLSGNLK